jgi:hypothetical protein
MLNSDQFIEQERRRLEVEAQTLARAKLEVLPPRRYAEPPAVPDATAVDLRKWQAGILGAFVAMTLSLLKVRHAGKVELVIWVVASFALLISLAYTRYRMFTLRRKQNG